MSVLLVGYKAVDLVEGFRRLACEPSDVVVHVLDIYHLHAIEKAWVGTVKAVCTPHLPPRAPDGTAWSRIVFRTGPKLMSGELALDLLQECHQVAGTGRPGAIPVVVEYVGRERDRNDLLDKVRDRIDRTFAAVWPASVPGGPKVMFTSYPGCFCHRRLDEGGLALAEVVSRELMERQALTSDLLPLTLLDMGCGCGLVSLLVNSVVKNLKLTLIDSHTRAIEAAQLNVKATGADADVILADDGLDSVQSSNPSISQSGNPSFDVFVGNPPYYSDYRIADVFLQTAKKALKPGGICYTVVKNDAGLKPVQERYFPSVAVIRRRGYCVLKSVKG